MLWPYGVTAVAAAVLCASLALLPEPGQAQGGSSSARDLPKPARPAAATGSVAEVVSAGNRLGWLLFDRLRRADAGKNVCLSPTSIALALHMTYNGAAGRTRLAMAHALQIRSIRLTALNRGNAALRASLSSADRSVTLALADSLWIRKGEVKPAFVAVNRTCYGAMVGDVDGAPKVVDAWVKRATHGRIDWICPRPFDRRGLVAILVNALYFKGAWTTAFDPAKTQDAPFTRSDGSRVTCRLMSRDGTFGYYKGEGFQMVRLPYGAGRLGLIALVPDAGVTLDTVLARADLQDSDAWTGKLRAARVVVEMPRFTSD
jgi:serpin B